MQTRLVASSFVFFGVTLVLCGCNEHAVDPFAPNVAAESIKTWEGASQAKVDILWVVDNSGSMCEEQRDLQDNYRRFIEILDGSGIDFNLAVVTTDIVQGGRFQNQPVGVTKDDACETKVSVDHCPTQLPTVISSSDERYRSTDGSLDVDALQRDFACNATVGVRGWGFEQGLESARMALSPQAVNDFNWGFLRPEAHLALVFVTDENDCSHVPNAIDADWGWECEVYSDNLTPVDEYIDFFASVKSDSDGTPRPDKVLVSGIFAADNGVRPQAKEEIIDACSGLSDYGEANSGWRYDEFLFGFDNSYHAEICTPPFDDAVVHLGEFFTKVVNRACLDAPVLSCESDTDCGAGSCQVRGAQQVCESFRVQLEVTRPAEMGSLENRSCEHFGDTLRCTLTEGQGQDFEIDYADDTCSHGVSFSLNYALEPGEDLTVRFPRAVGQ